MAKKKIPHGAGKAITNPTIVRATVELDSFHPKDDLVYESEKVRVYHSKKNNVDAYYRFRPEHENEGCVLFCELSGGDMVYIFTEENRAIDFVYIKNYSRYYKNDIQDNRDKKYLMPFFPRFIKWHGFGFRESAMETIFRSANEDYQYGNIFLSDSIHNGVKDAHSFYFTLDEFEKLFDSLTQQNWQHQETKRLLVADYIRSEYPELVFNCNERNTNKLIILDSFCKF